MGRYGLRVRRLVINNVVCEPDSAFLKAKAGEQQGYIRRIRQGYGDREIVEIPMFPGETKGLARLQEIAGALFT
jgi:arsenite-transporting ATPase